MYEPYVSVTEYYEARDKLPVDKAQELLVKSSRHVDALTFNRIQAAGFENLTEYQRDIIKEVVTEQAEFIFENEDLINSVINSYSINGVSVNFSGGMNIVFEGGMPLRATTYTTLKQSGLCCRLAV